MIIVLPIIASSLVISLAILEVICAFFKYNLHEVNKNAIKSDDIDTAEIVKLPESIDPNTMLINEIIQKHGSKCIYCGATNKDNSPAELVLSLSLYMDDFVKTHDSLYAICTSNNEYYGQIYDNSYGKKCYKKMPFKQRMRYRFMKSCYWRYVVFGCTKCKGQWASPVFPIINVGNPTIW